MCVCLSALCVAAPCLAPIDSLACALPRAELVYVSAFVPTLLHVYPQAAAAWSSTGRLWVCVCVCECVIMSMRVSVSLTSSIFLLAKTSDAAVGCMRERAW